MTVKTGDIKTRNITPREASWPYGDDAATAFIQEISNGSCTVYWVYLEIAGSNYDLEVTIGHFFNMEEAVSRFNAEVRANQADTECESCGRYVPATEITPGGDRQTINGPQAYPDTCFRCR